MNLTIAFNIMKLFKSYKFSLKHEFSNFRKYLCSKIKQTNLIIKINEY